VDKNESLGPVSQQFWHKKLRSRIAINVAQLKPIPTETLQAMKLGLKLEALMRHGMYINNETVCNKLLTNCYIPFHEWQRYVTIVTYRSRAAPFLHDNGRKYCIVLQIP
jgi:hypothetical protein